MYLLGVILGFLSMTCLYICFMTTNKELKRLNSIVFLLKEYDEQMLEALLIFKERSEVGSSKYSNHSKLTKLMEERKMHVSVLFRDGRVERLLNYMLSSSSIFEPDHQMNFKSENGENYMCMVVPYGDMLVAKDFKKRNKSFTYEETDDIDDVIITIDQEITNI